MDLRTTAAGYLRTVIQESICLAPTSNALVLFDEESSLARVLTAAYREALPAATFVNVPETGAERVLELIKARPAGDLVVLVQSTSFRLNEFRLRIELFERGLKTIEHLHLMRMSEAQEGTYVESLRFQKEELEHDGKTLKALLEKANCVEVFGPNGAHLVFPGGMEEPKLNIGNYEGMKNVGGTFPIGELFTEAKELFAVHGTVALFGLANMEHYVELYEPFLVNVEGGLIQLAGTEPAEFQNVIKLISATERPMIREFGLGLNRAMNRHVMVNDITAYERQRGLHLSLGEKHGVYKKEGFNRKETRYHVDVFVAIERMTADGVVFYEKGEFVFV